MGVSQSTVWRWKTKEIIRKHTNAIKPLLNDKNKLDRLIFCLSSCILDDEGINFRFNDMSNSVHIDEKLFYLTRTQQTYYLTPDRNLSFYNSSFSLEELKEQEEREHRDQTSIRNKWPQEASKKIFIQQENAKPHILDDDLRFREAATFEGFDFHLVQQPPNSPDMNVLDLGFFRSIQALQHKKSAYNYTQMVRAVTNAFESLQPSTMKFVWITLQACKVEVIRKLGA
ncbi:uncharacterized protein LOC130808575 [Amaranthus tricolor]|uniref:uncharacterized protein LOC130808575 n=1 Tax=Amaranthus tricolor TaxID=29722 RepID=UPI002588955B|nr:uncharacterized protein LOC130808575 [Amaranthus tricolor]